jgi:hypothetical protein
MVKKASKQAIKKTQVRRKTIKKPQQELDSVFFLKIVVYMVLGSLWIRLVNPDLTAQIPIPIGLGIGLLIASHEHFQIDRKIEFSVLLVSALIGFWVQTGAMLVVLN